jgi:ATP-dependent Clp protease ATP-binding subunit ClpC
VDEALKKLIDDLIACDDDDVREHTTRVVTYLDEHKPSVEELLELLDHPNTRAQQAAVEASKERLEPEITARLRALMSSRAGSLRAAAARSLGPRLTDDEIRTLLLDEDEEVRVDTLGQVGTRTALHPAVVERLRTDSGWRTRQHAAVALRVASPLLAFVPLLLQLGEDSDSDVRRACAEALDLMAQTFAAQPENVPPEPAIDEMRAAFEGLNNLNKRIYRAPARWLEERLDRAIDLKKLATFGRVLTLPEELKRLPRAYGIERVCDSIEKILLGDAPRAVVVLGEPGAGKTAVIHEVIHRLATRPDAPWHALSLSPSDFLSGTRYLGEWESRLDDLVKSIRAPRRVLLYITGIAQLSQVGTTGKSDANVAAMLAPYIERGELAVLGESSTEEFRSGVGGVGSLRRLFSPVELLPTTREQTQEILQSICAEQGVHVSDGLLDRLMELVGFYITRSSEPGRSAGLMRRMLGAVPPAAGSPAAGLTERDILQQLSSSTGIPATILDDSVPLDRGRTREFFEARVMGQTEAVGALIDLVTLIKAGLTDPDKPLGVLFFVGPTGVGKTELARALAELLFGDRERLIRIDMSEYATFDAFERLIGHGDRPGSLTEPVREHPFSVVLLDEIEKAHVNVFDLCLQMFDAGRLTDAKGRICDLRRTIIILTSNIGSRVERDGTVGFGRGGGTTTPEREGVLRELGRVFRPEFLNRIDRIILFRPLDAETAAKIARREVVAVLARSGISRRRLAVDVDESVLALLLREGYSLAFGARPLKRTVERVILLPLAEQISAGKVPPGSVLRLHARQGRIELNVTPPEPDFDVLSTRGVTVPPPKKSSHTAEPALGIIAEELHELRPLAEQIATRKTDLLAKAAGPGFWVDQGEARRVLDDIYRLEGLLGQFAGVDEAVRVARQPEGDEPRPPADLDALRRRVSHVGQLLRTPTSAALADAYVQVTRVSAQGEALHGVETLARMYLALARREHFDAEVLDDRQGGSPAEDAIGLLISGAGASSLLLSEAGLHQLSRGKQERVIARSKRPVVDREERTHKKIIVGREVVRVEITPVSTQGAPLRKEDIRTDIRPLRGEKGRLLDDPSWDVHLVHLPTMLAIHAWMRGDRNQVSERALSLLRSKVEARREAQTDEGSLVRRYTLGPIERVRDLKTGRASPRLDLVLAGDLSPLGSPVAPLVDS